MFLSICCETCAINSNCSSAKKVSTKHQDVLQPKRSCPKCRNKLSTVRVRQTVFGVLPGKMKETWKCTGDSSCGWNGTISQSNRQQLPPQPVPLREMNQWYQIAERIYSERSDDLYLPSNESKVQRPTPLTLPPLQLVARESPT